MKRTRGKCALLAKNMRFIRVDILAQTEWQFAAGCGITKSAISAIECGYRTPSTELYMAVIGYLYHLDRMHPFTEKQAAMIRMAFSEQYSRDLQRVL